MAGMQAIDPKTGRAYLEKRRRRYPVPRQLPCSRLRVAKRAADNAEARAST
jgi:hypothetical protein